MKALLEASLYLAMCIDYYVHKYLKYFMSNFRNP